MFCVDLAYSQCQYENSTNTLGIGLVEYDNYNHTTPMFEAYNDPELTDKFCSWDIYKEIAPPFCAKFHKPDYGIIQVVVLDSLTQAYKVLVNENDIKYVPRNINYVYRSWGEYLMQSHGVRRKLEEAKFKNYSPRNQPKDSSRIIELPKEPFEHLCVMEVNGDWIKVKYDCFYNQNQNPNEGLPCSEYIRNCPDAPTGWLKWRIKNEITVDIFLMP